MSSQNEFSAGVYKRFNLTWVRNEANKQLITSVILQRENQVIRLNNKVGSQKKIKQAEESKRYGVQFLGVVRDQQK